MKYAGINYNDIAAAPGLSVTVFTQGCPHRCPGCHNPETWDFNSGKEFTMETLDSIIKGLTAQGIERNLCIMGGEPLCPENIFLTYFIISNAKQALPDIKVYIWTGYVYEDLLNSVNPRMNDIFKLTDTLIDGPYIDELRDVTLLMRGSSNQRIIDLK